MYQFGGGSQQQPEISAEHSGGNGKAPRYWMPANASVNDILEKKGHCEGSFNDETIEVLSSPKNYDPQENLLEKFEDVGFHHMLLTNIQRMNYKNPRLIQKYAIPAILEGFHVVGQSETASGKTAVCFFISKLSHESLFV
uniref:RNA helicase n=1 Tax=Panagrolaimus davidi TaxID=227884 RepID=A0A914PIA5_9BILA